MNSNWEEEFTIPIGPDNNIEPGGPDRGQPTHFFPRRNMFLFTTIVPADFGDNELVWTLRTNGETNRVYASLLTDYLLDRQTIGRTTAVSSTSSARMSLPRSGSPWISGVVWA